MVATIWGADERIFGFFFFFFFVRQNGSFLELETGEDRRFGRLLINFSSVFDRDICSLLRSPLLRWKLERWFVRSVFSLLDQ